MNRMENSRGNIMHQVKVNIFYKNHVERMRMDVYNLGKTEVILEIPQLQAYNLVINWETREVKIMRYPSLCGRNLTVKEDIEWRKKIRNMEKADKDEWEWTIEENFNEEIELNREKVKKIVPQKFHRWLKIFEKVELKRILMRKPWDHTINLKENFAPKKKRTYLISRQEKEKV